MRLYSLSVLYKGDPKVHLLKAAYDVSTFNFFQRSRWVPGMPDSPEGGFLGEGGNLPSAPRGFRAARARPWGEGVEALVCFFFLGGEGFFPVLLPRPRGRSDSNNGRLRRDDRSREAPVGSCGPRAPRPLLRNPPSERSCGLGNGAKPRFPLRAARGRQQELRFDSVNHPPSPNRKNLGAGKHPERSGQLFSLRRVPKPGRHGGSWDARGEWEDACLCVGRARLA